jgi:hypothetical protein
LKRCHAVITGIAHTGAAAQRERTQMCALIAQFGMPAIMFTICPLDRFCFQIMIHAQPDKGFDGIPEGSPESDQVHEFVLNMDRIVNDYPGIVAMEYENAISIVVRHILGYDMGNGGNIPDKGLFSDIEACCPCTEEQGRKSLHSHILVWLKGWSELLEALASDNEQTKNRAVSRLIKFTSTV